MRKAGISAIAFLLRLEVLFKVNDGGGAKIVSHSRPFSSHNGQKKEEEDGY